MAKRDNIGIALKELIDPTAKTMGFKKRGRTYFRVVGEMFQSFTLVRFGNHDCSYRFEIVPLCAGITHLYEGIYDVSDFYIPTEKFHIFGQYVDTFFDENGQLWGIESPESVNRVAQLLSSLMHEHIFPLFERTTDVTTAFNELANMMEMIDENRRMCYFIDHGILREKQYKKEELVGDDFWYLALRNQDFKFVRNICKRLIESWQNSLVNNSNTSAGLMKNIERYQNYLNKIDSKEYNFFYDELAQNELRSKEFLSSIGWKFNAE